MRRQIRKQPPGINHALILKPCILTLEQKRNNVLSMFQASGRQTMLKVFVEEAAALASIALFVGMVAVWAQVLSQL